MVVQLSLGFQPSYEHVAEDISSNTPVHFVPKIQVYKWLSLGYGSLLVEISANFLSEGTWRIFRVLSFTLSLVKLWETCMCFVASFCLGFCVRSVADLLSVHSTIGTSFLINWLIPWIIQINCLVASYRPLYSALLVEREIVLCLQVFQLKVDSPDWYM